MGRELKAAGTHILGIKDMAGLCQPSAAYTLVKALKEELGLPVHFHTHDTSGIAAASVLAAVAAGCDAVDGAIDAMSGLHVAAEPRLHRRSAALRPRDPGIDHGEPARHLDVLGAGAQELPARSRATCARARPRCTCTACPAGSTPNLKEQARSVGLDDSRWPEVSQAYADVNQMFGNIVKVTPSSKVVGDHGAADGVERPHARSRCSTRTSKSRSPSPWCR